MIRKSGQTPGARLFPHAGSGHTPSARLTPRSVDHFRRSAPAPMIPSTRSVLEQAIDARPNLGSRALGAFAEIWRAIPSVGAQTKDWVPMLHVEGESPWGLVYRIGSRYKIAGSILAAAMIAPLALVATGFTSVGATMHDFFLTTPLGQSLYVFCLSFIIPTVMGLTNRGPLETSPPGDWYMVYHMSQKNQLMRGITAVNVFAVLYLLTDSLFGLMPGTGPFLHKALRDLPLGIGGYLWIVGSLYVLPSLRGLIRSWFPDSNQMEHRAPPSTWGLQYKISRLSPFLGSAIFFTWGWVMSNALTSYSSLGPMIRDFVAQKPDFAPFLGGISPYLAPLGPVLFTLFAILAGIPVARALFFDRSRSKWEARYGETSENAIKTFMPKGHFVGGRIEHAGEMRPDVYFKRGKTWWDLAADVGRIAPAITKPLAAVLGITVALDSVIAPGTFGFGDVHWLKTAVDYLPLGLGKAIMGLIFTLCVAAFFSRPKTLAQRYEEMTS